MLWQDWALNSSSFSALFPLVWRFLYSYCIVFALRALCFRHARDHISMWFFLFFPANICLPQSHSFQYRKKVALFAAPCCREAWYGVVLQCTSQSSSLFWETSKCKNIYPLFVCPASQLTVILVGGFSVTNLFWSSLQYSNASCLVNPLALLLPGFSRAAVCMSA